MLFYGKEINITYVIVIVILILAAYIIYSSYQQQRQFIPMMTTSSQPITQSLPTKTAVPEKTILDNGAFAISLWVNLNSALPITPSNNYNLMRLTNTTTSTTPPIITTPLLNLTLDNAGNLIVSYSLNSSTQSSSIMLFPIREPVNIVLNYNGDDDIDVDKSETVYDPTTNKNIPIYNTNSNSFYLKNRALDVYINGLLNNTLIIDTLTNSSSNANSPYVTYMDASMNYVTTNGNLIVIGDNQTSASLALDGTISNVMFVKNGCSPQDVRNIFNQGNSGSILDNILSYKLRFSLLEDNKEVKTYDVL
jgi:hypothetical protein